MSSLERVPPQNLEAEQSVLGAMLIEKEAIIRAMELLGPDDFYREAHRGVYAAMASLFDRNEPVDLVTVSEELRGREQLEMCGGLTYLTALANSVPTAANIEHYALIVREKSILRRLISAATRVVSRCFEAREEVPEILDSAEQAIFAIASLSRRRGTDQLSLKQIMIDAFDHIERLAKSSERVTGIPTGFDRLNRLTAGFQPSDLIILAARPSVGKTTLALNFVRTAAVSHGKAVLYFSLEQAALQLSLRLLASESGVDSNLLRIGRLARDDWRELARASGRLGSARVFIDDTPNLSAMEVRTRARRLKSEADIDLVVIDYLQLMHTGGRTESRQQEISEISRLLKALGRELNVPIIALSQLRRAVEQREGERPQLSDLRESGAIEQDADVVMFIYQDPKDREQSTHSEAKIELIVAKQRNGPTGAVHLFFRRDTGRFFVPDTIHEDPVSMVK
ncbi:MAG: replicative DNA helicase [Bacillota bacterium]|nr:replicative DNA helicase [Bacillota bacterium]